MKTRHITYFILIFFVLLQSCAVQKVDSSGSKNKALLKLKAVPHSGDTMITKNTVYRLGFGDKLEIKFFKNPEYNEEVIVRPDGRISLQRIDDIYVVNLTPQQLDKAITTVYSKILVDPEVTVFVREFGGQEVYVLGEVENPGAHGLVKGMTALRAIIKAGGYNNQAKLNSVILIRDRKNGYADVYRLNLQLKDIATMRQDVPLQARDIIYVPKTFIGDVNNFVNQFYDVFLPPLDVWTRFYYWYSLR